MTMTMTKPHGKKPRYTVGCRCTKCMAWAGHRPVPDGDIRWPFHFIRKHKDRLSLWYSPDEIADMRARGLDDITADRVAVKLFGTLPYNIWPGWLEAGLDTQEDPDDHG